MPQKIRNIFPVSFLTFGILFFIFYCNSPIHSKANTIGQIIPANSEPKIITHADTSGKKLAALTFDDGPDPRFTPKILSILQNYHIKATFFVVGTNAKTYPSLIKEEMDEGNEIENHTYDHPDLQKDNAVEITQEILQAQYIIKNLTGREPHYFRPPKGLFNAQSLNIAAANRLETVLWTVGVENHNCSTPLSMSMRVINKARPGIIILAHDGRLDRSKTVKALPAIIKGYQRLGYKFVTLEQLFKYQNAKI